VPEIVIPDPSLVVLVGAAGAGKSTFAARHFDSAEVLSSDRYRGIVSGDETDQTATRAAFSLLHRDLARRLAAGLTTVVDATNIEPWARRTVVRRAHAAAVPAVAIVPPAPRAPPALVPVPAVGTVLPVPAVGVTPPSSAGLQANASATK
jgi:predicted kinase